MVASGDPLLNTQRIYNAFCVKQTILQLVTISPSIVIISNRIAYCMGWGDTQIRLQKQHSSMERTAIQALPAALECTPFWVAHAMIGLNNIFIIIASIQKSSQSLQLDYGGCCCR